MRTAVLCAVRGAVETQVVRALGVPGSRATVVRRCADLAELLASAAAGLGKVAVVSGDFADLDRDAVQHLHDSGVWVVALADPRTGWSLERVRGLGVDRVVDASGIEREVLLAVTDLADAAASRPGPGAHGARPSGVQTGGGPVALLPSDDPTGAATPEAVADLHGAGPAVPAPPAAAMVADASRVSARGPGAVFAAAQGAVPSVPRAPESIRVPSATDPPAGLPGVGGGPTPSTDLASRTDEVAPRSLRRRSTSDGPGHPRSVAHVMGRWTGHRWGGGRPPSSAPGLGVLSDTTVRSDGASHASTHDAGADARGAVIAVWGPTGAPGRTTLALNLAAELADQGALLVDADTYGGTVAQVLGLLDEAPGVAAAARAAATGRLDAGALAALTPRLEGGLRVLTGVSRADRWPEVPASGLEVVWACARQLARWTVVDCGFSLEQDEALSYDTRAPRRNAATLSALGEADVVVVVGSGDPIGLQRLVRALGELTDRGVPAESRRVVVNRVRASASGPRPGEAITEALRRYAGVQGVHLVPEDRSACDGAVLAARTLREHAPASPARTSIAALAGAFDPVGTSVGAH